MNTVLVVDDRPDARYKMTRTLAAAGFDVRETATGRDALRLARMQPDAIVLDIVLDDIDGFEVVRRLKSDPVTENIPVVHRTAVYRDDDHRQLALAAGADDYLMEPFEPQALVAAVRHALDSRRSQASESIRLLRLNDDAWMAATHLAEAFGMPVQAFLESLLIDLHRQSIRQQPAPTRRRVRRRG
jgi:DNA-binding response OmpR family regulator